MRGQRVFYGAGDRGQCPLMEHNVHTRNGFAHRRHIGQASLQKFYLMSEGGQVLPSACRKVVQEANFRSQGD